MGRKFLKQILTYLYCTKYNEIDVWHLDVHKHVSYTVQILVYKITEKVSYMLWTTFRNATAGNGFSIVFHNLFLLY